ncbi:hypothetical protein JCM5350_007289 [Sporobolomyces pararoseus]
MSAIEWANEVLSLPSSSKFTLIRQEDLPAPADGLAQAWCTELRDDALSEESQKLILKALRLSRLLRSHDLIIDSITPLLVSSSPSIRLQAAGALLQYTSISSSEILQHRTLQIVSTIRKTLALLRLTIQSSSSPSSTSRFVSTCFRILSTVVSKVSTLMKEVFESIVTLLANWIYHGPSIGGSASPAPSRGRTTIDSNQLSFGVMSAFAQASISPTKRRPAATSSRTSSSERGGASESESEDGRKYRRSDSAQIRLDAVTCLRSLAKNNPRELQRHWHHFLSDSPYLRNRSTLLTLVESDPSREVRLQACSALEAMLEDSSTYLAIAQDRPAKASFTSLSTKVGEIVSELYLSLTSLLDRPVGVGQVELRLSILSVARKLSSCSPYGRMKRSLAGPLAKAISNSLSSEDSDVVEASLSTLSAISERYISTASQQLVAWEEIVVKAEKLLEADLDVRNEISLWRFLASTVVILPEQDWNFALDHIKRNFDQISPSLQAARIGVLLAFFPTTHSYSLTEKDTPLPTSFPTVIPLVLASLDSRYPSSRALACSILAHAFLSSNIDIRTLDWANKLARDEDSEVSRSAHRSLGLILRDSNDTDSEQYRQAIGTLIDGFLDDTVCDGDVCWSLANGLDGFAQSHISTIDTNRVLQRSISLLSDSSRDEPVYISCLRVLGSMLRLKSGDTDVEMFEGTFSTFSQALQSSSAKVRWNACTSLNSSLPSLTPSILGSSSFSRLFGELVDILGNDSSYKVRIHTAALLLTIVNATNQSAEVNLEKVKRVATEAKGNLQDQLEEGRVQAKERRHVEILIKKLDFLISLRSL